MVAKHAALSFWLRACAESIGQSSQPSWLLDPLRSLHFLVLDLVRHPGHFESVSSLGQPQLRLGHIPLPSSLIWTTQ